MATIPGGLFDSSTNSNIDVHQGALISSFLDSLGLSETQLTQIVVSTTGTNAIGDTVSAAVFTVGSGQPMNVVLSGSSGATVNISGSGNASVAGSFGGGSDILLGGSGNSSTVVGGDDAIFRLQALTLPDAELDLNATGDSLTGGGPAISNNQANYLYNAAKDFGASSVMLTDIVAALKLLSTNGTTPASALSTFFGRLSVSPGSTLTELDLDMSKETSDILLMTRLKDIPGVTYVFSGIEKLLLVGEGSARLGGNQSAMVVADSNNQFITGGGGNDTLVGGGGTDTLAGGAGSDIFGFNTKGHYTITDFVQGTDKLAFQIGGVTSNASLSDYLTSIENAGGNTTYHFGPNASITLVGITTTELLSDMLFNIS